MEDFSSIVGKGKTAVFKSGTNWPGVWYPELLSLTDCWRTPESQELVARGVDRMAAMYPNPSLDVKAKCKNARGGTTAYGVVWFRPSPELPDQSGQWYKWFAYAEQLARSGVTTYSSVLCRQVEQLASLLDKSSGWFIEPVSPRPFLEWDIYSGLALEEKKSADHVWEWASAERQKYDLTFRSLLIMHHAGYLKA